MDISRHMVPPQGNKTLLESLFCPNINELEADIAIVGVPFSPAYEAAAISGPHTIAPDAIRAASEYACRGLDKYDFDVGGLLYGGAEIRVCDVGNVTLNMLDLARQVDLSQAVIRQILERGAMPIVMGGDHGITIPVLRAFEGKGPITLVQIDAHLDWRDEVNGVTEGRSSPVRRASEMSHIGDIFQIGLRSQGSARPQEVEDALAYGATIIPAFEVHDRGIDHVIDMIPDGGQYFITFDVDGLDPTVAPAVDGPAPGGLNFYQARKLIHGLVAKGRVVGMDVVEVRPPLDVNMITSITAARLIANLIGASARANYF
jgi:agmatinase